MSILRYFAHAPPPRREEHNAGDAAPPAAPLTSISCLCYNANSLSAYGISDQAKVRFNKLLRFSQSQIRHHGIILIQETHLGSNADQLLRNYLPNCYLSMSSPSRNQGSNHKRFHAGLLTII